MKLHPKILELRKRRGYQPMFEASSFVQPEAIRAANTTVSDDSRLIKQYFCLFGIADDYGTVPMKGCFAKSINDRGPQSNASYKITVLNQHDQKDPLCIPMVLKEDEVGLYGEYEPDPMPSGDRLLLQVRRGTINNGSYGFNYVWDKMKYDEETDTIKMYECNLYEVSPVTIGSQEGTFVVRGANGEVEDETLEEDTEHLIKMMPRKHQLELRSLINRHIQLAKLKPSDLALDEHESVASNKGLDLNYLISKLS